ncbi:MAG: IPT/TIG domain-containing protein [Endomicrobiales bacterium]|nr:IPT/TIG domain-containing protein [Endomicrobiales bacterium]
MKKYFVLIIILLFLGCEQRPLINRMITGASNDNAGINSVSPSPMVMGESVTITGENFGDSQGSSKLYLNDIELTAITSWSDTSITFTLPSSGIRPGELKVITVYGEVKKSNIGLLQSFYIPFVQAADPTNTHLYIQIGDKIKMTGTGQVTSSYYGTTGPEGDTSDTHIAYSWFDGQRPCQSLVFKISSSKTTGYGIGDEFITNNVMPGELYIGITNWNPGIGAYTATIEWY